MSYESYPVPYDPSLPIIGLFGTCGGSQWRDAFIQQYRAEGIQWFNPNKQNWSPEDADCEAQHLLADDIVCFPVLGETYGSASLAESSLSIMRAVDRDRHKYTIVLIEDIEPRLEADNPRAYKESRNAREIIRRHLSQVRHDRVFIVPSLAGMLTVSLHLHRACLCLDRARESCLHPNPSLEQKSQLLT